MPRCSAGATAPPSPRRLVAALALTLTGCTGMVGDGGTSPASGSAPGSKPNTPGVSNPGTGATTDPMTGTMLPPVGSSPMEPVRESEACKAIKPGPAPIRRLTRQEYDNTLKDLLGEDKKLAADFPNEELLHGFDNSASLRSVSDVLAEKYSNAAEQVGKHVAANITKLAPCQGADDVCLDKFFDGFGKRLWRRPLDASEREDLKKVFTAGKTSTFADGIDAVVQVMVLAPQFMYRVEKGVPVAGADYSRLTHFEMASRLSYLFWGTMPDADLFSAAEAGKLGTREEVSIQAKRLLADPRATAMVQNFAAQWLHLRDLRDADKDAEVYPKWKEEYLDLFRQETEAFVAMVFQGDGKLDTLLSAPFTALNGPLAAFYGAKNVTGDAFQKVELDPSQRAGVLTHASVLAAKADPNQSSPILRGAFVREQIFCQELPPVPQSLVNAAPPELNDKMTTKERFAQHRNDPSCEGCHKLIDSIGFGFEKYDGTGGFRTTENGKNVDASGELVSTDIDGTFDGAVDLAKKLTASKEVEACMATHWFNFGFGRGKSDVDACTVETLQTTFVKSGGDIRQLLLALVQTDAFFFKGGLQ